MSVVNGGCVVHCDICGRWLCCTVMSVVNGGRVVHCDVCGKWRLYCTVMSVVVVVVLYTVMSVVRQAVGVL